jgi:flagellar basal-body rod protein FlgB
MDLQNISVFKALTQKMTWLNERQKVLAQNLANANTPGYLSKDLKKVSFQAHLNNTNSNSDSNPGSGGLAMQVDEAGHIAVSGPMSANFQITEVKASFSQSSPDGNSVDLESELSKMADVQMEYTMASNLYKKNISMMKTALGKR